MLRVQNFLRNGGTLAQLQSKYALHIRRGQEFPNLVLLKYDQIDSPMGDPLVRQCRGIILDETDDWRAVSRPFDKFFNAGEGHAAKIDWETAVVQEKLDGSLMQLYWYKDEWRVGTSGTPDASGEVNGCGFTFKELFWRVWNEKKYCLPEPRNRTLTYLFELMTPYNRVVVRHDKNELKLIGVRSTITGDEYPMRWWSEEDEPGLLTYNWDVVQEFPLTTFKDVEKTFETMDPLAQEGYVVVDENFNRVKVKHPGYVAIHHMRDGLGPKRILEVVRSGETTELLTHFPEWTEPFNKVKAAYEEFVQELEAYYAGAVAATAVAVPPGVVVSPAWLQKEFASHATKSRYSAPLFMLRAGKVDSIRQALARTPIKSLMELLGIKDIEL